MEIELHGPTIKALRRAKKYSLERLARAVNRHLETDLSRSAIAQWESGVTSPTMKHLCALALALGVDDLNIFFVRRPNGR